MQWVMLLACVVVAHSFDVTEWLGDQVAHPTDESLNKFAQELWKTGHVHVPGFLKKDTVAAFLKEMDSVFLPEKDSAITVFQDAGEHTHFAADHPRNILMPRHISFGPREAILNVHCSHVKDGDYSGCSRILALYHSEAVLQFWRSIISRVPLSPVDPFDTVPRNIFFSHDKAGSVYGLRIPHDGIKDGNWHVDEHSYSCVLMLQTPELGGEFAHAKFKDAWAHMNDPHWDRWDDLGLLLANKVPGEPSTFPVYSIAASAGDAYCFYGDEDLHNIGNVKGDVSRIVVVFAYADSADFQHNEDVNSHNDWVIGEKSKEECL